MVVKGRASVLSVLFSYANIYLDIKKRSHRSNGRITSKAIHAHTHVTYCLLLQDKSHSGLENTSLICQ